jgi:hypothetical protein
LPACLAALEHVDEGHGALAQRHVAERRGHLAVGLGLVDGGLLLGFFARDRASSADQRGGHLRRFDDALRAGVLADDLQHAAAVRLQHDQVAGRLAFELVEHQE